MKVSFFSLHCTLATVAVIDITFSVDAVSLCIKHLNSFIVMLLEDRSELAIFCFFSYFMVDMIFKVIKDVGGKVFEVT